MNIRVNEVGVAYKTAKHELEDIQGDYKYYE
jgi:hypothetical protein